MELLSPHLWGRLDHSLAPKLRDVLEQTERQFADVR